MDKNQASCLISPERISHIKVQGYDTGFSDEDISEHSVGNRFAYQMCTILFTSGLVLTSIPILAVAAGIAFLTLILPYHPFDYLFNYGIRHWLGKPKLPHRTPQAKFACTIATVWLSVIIYLFYTSYFTLGYVLGGILFVVAFLVSVFDFCIPSIIYNALFKKMK